MKTLKKSLKLLKKYKSYLFLLTPFRKPVLKSGKGVWVTDIDGNKYLDLMSGQFSLPLGHCHKEFNEVLYTQAKKILHTNTLYLTEEVFRGIKAVASITAKGLKKTAFLSTGAEAVEFAIRHAKFYTKKEGIVSLTSGYHGLTLATQSLSKKGIYAKPLVPKSYHIPTPNHLNSPDGKITDKTTEACLEKSKKKLAQYKGKIAAFIVEPIISVGGMIFLPKKYLLGLKKLADEHKALLIFDECQTGLGRTGKWFGYEYFNIVPDILILAKGAGLGFPTSLVVMKNRIAKEVEGKIEHFSSHQDDPISGVTIEFLINYIRKHKLLKKIRRKGNYLLKMLKRISKENNLLQNPRGLGLMIGFDINEKFFNKRFNPGKELISLLEQDGILIQATRRGRTFRILPSYEITNKEIDIFIRSLRKCLRLLESKLPIQQVK